jgi:hypothetical protein
VAIADSPEGLILVCERCGVAVEDQDAHDQFHTDIATMAGSVLEVLDRIQQQNRFTLTQGLTLQSGIPAAEPGWWERLGGNPTTIPAA